ncbi:fungal-specific transcription factor domain-containing protein [Vararia minispora EC-137]|uniref:Fungal-specific transcription factor domain-containing protein n=1 Tax=Vararia minispora EC-137 TaxID=1314806 RepID=A0ACB8QQC8_9AGAM|nr:fungal-specific transcription factor domain-containing protein [Vararia minispora EC-137]
MSTPPTEQLSFSNPHKRPSSASTTDGERKRQRQDEAVASPTDREEPKAKSTRGSRACTVCRRLKMKCVGAEQGPPCKRCLAGGHDCIFEESNRGKRSSKKTELLTRSLRKMERTLDTVLKSIGNPSIASGMISRSPSPSDGIALRGTQDLLSQQDDQSAAGSSSQSMLNRSPKLHSLPDNSLNPLGLLAEASLANRRSQSGRALQKATSSLARPSAAVGVASDAYFKPGPMTILPLRRLFIERQIQPEMLSFVSTDEVVALFNIFFDHMNMHCNVLDRDFHTPALVCSRSPFLLTTICAISSKFYTARPDLHAKLTDLSKKLAFSVPAQGYKSVEIVQAYLLLSVWGCGPVERYEQDRTWLLLGMAIRMATDLNLHRKTSTFSPETAEGKAREREVHNRERTWLVCFCLDRSLSAQMGKPFTIKEDAIIRDALQWVRSPLAQRGDFPIAAYVELQRIMSRSLELLSSDTRSASGLQMDIDYMVVLRTFERQIETWYQHVVNADNPTVADDKMAKYHKVMPDFYGNYSLLVINSFGLQNALDHMPVDIPHFFGRVLSSARKCATLIRDALAPGGFLKYAPDSHFVYGAYAVLSFGAFSQVLRPEFPLSPEDENDILDLGRDVVDAFESVAAGPLHTPSLYGAFLRALLNAKAEASNSESHAAPSNDSRANNSGAVGSEHAGNGPTEDDPVYPPLDFQFASEMGPVVDISTFPPTMASNRPEDDGMGILSMDSILSGGFWDNVLVPGYSNAMEGLSGGFVYGVGGSGFITPHISGTPMASRTNSPRRDDLGHQAIAFHAPVQTDAIEAVL